MGGVEHSCVALFQRAAAQPPVWNRAPAAMFLSSSTCLVFLHVSHSLSLVGLPRIPVWYFCLVFLSFLLLSHRFRAQTDQLGTKAPSPQVAAGDG